MKGGFSFKGVHSSTFGVYQSPSSRMLIAGKRRELSEPLNSENVIIQDKGYDYRIESISCSYMPSAITGQPIISIPTYEQARRIAKWLDGVGELNFDYEPDKFYTAMLNNAPPLTASLEVALFPLEFLIAPAHAYERIQSNNNLVANKLTVNVGGTMSTPPYITIRNTGTTPITNLLIEKKSYY